MRIFSPLSRCLPLLAGLASALSLAAQDYDEPEMSSWYVRVGAAARFNLKATITPVANAAGSSGNYDNGFVLPDIGGSTNLTWNWGFNDASQVDAGRELLNYYRYDNIPSPVAVDVPISSPLLGGEVIGGYRVSEFKIKKRPARLAFELGYGYSGFSEKFNSAVAGSASYVTAAYNYSGLILPVPPYSGTYAGPGPLLNLNPDATSTASDGPGATLNAVQGSLKSTIHEMRFGPLLEVDLSRKLTLAVGGGYSAIYVDAEAEYSKSVTFGNASIPSLAPVNGKVSEAKWRPGAYIEARLDYRISKLLSAYVGGDVHFNNSLTFGDANYTVNIDPGLTYGAKVGVIFNF